MIFYFSGTGNTEWAAREMSAALGEELRPIPRLDPEKEVFTLRPDETIGFCFPVHAWRPPAIVREFFADSGLAGDEVERIAFLVGHHHTLEGIDGPDWHILIEADYFVNAA